MTNPGLTPARRKLLRGAAWAAPAALVTATAPAIAASPFTRTFAANRPSATSATAVTTRWTVPAGVTRIRVDVVGAGGGGGPQSQVGSGARITGELSVAPGQTVEMIAGAGGSRDPANDAAVAGGGGHGAGANNTATISATGTTVRANGGRPAANGNGGPGAGAGGATIASGTTALEWRYAAGAAGASAANAGAGARGADSVLSSTSGTTAHYSGGGGGGGNYVSTAVTGSVSTLAGNGAKVERVRNPGSITITY